MVCVGIDVAKDKHDCCILDSEGTTLVDCFTIPNNMDPCKFQCQSNLAHRTAERFEQCHQGLTSHHRRLQHGTSAFRQPPQNNVLILL